MSILVRWLPRGAREPVRRFFAVFGLDVQYFGTIPAGIPDRQAYLPRFRPWVLADWQRRFAATRGKTLVSDDRLYVLAALLRQALLASDGAVIECGVYQGGTARLLVDTIDARAPNRRLYLCDTFSGMPETDAAVDVHRKGDFADTSLDAVRTYLGPHANVTFVAGLIPRSLAPLTMERFCFAHLDLDIYDAIVAATRFVYERVVPGGFIVYDDYGFATTPGARRAVDEFYADKRETPLVLASGQCVVFKQAP